MTPDNLPREFPETTSRPACGNLEGLGGQNRRSDPQSHLPREFSGSPRELPSRLPPPYKGREAGNCTPSPGGRVLPGRHAQDCTGDCTGCQPCPGPHCQDCGAVHAQDTCPTCLGTVRDLLARLTDLTTRLETEATQGRHAFHIHSDVPGGDALVMLAAAATVRGRTGQPLHLFTPYELPGDPQPPLDVLVFWEELWRRKVHQPTRVPPTMERVAAYLDGQLQAMAQDRLFPHLHKALRRVVHQTENVLHEGHRPDVSRVPCLNCGTRLVKVWTTQEHHDHHRCPTCGEQYDKGRYERALHDHLASKGAARYVPISDACAASGRSERTVRDWVRRETVDSTRDPLSGRLLVWWPHVRERHQETRMRGRTG